MNHGFSVLVSRRCSAAPSPTPHSSPRHTHCDHHRVRSRVPHPHRHPSPLAVCVVFASVLSWLGIFLGYSTSWFLVRATRWFASMMLVFAVLSFRRFAKSNYRLLMAESKTKPTNASVDGFLATVIDDRRRVDAIALDEMIRTIARLSPVMWGASIVGYGSRTFQGAAGVAEWPLVGFSPRKANLVLYLSQTLDDVMFEDLGKHRRGVGCLYVSRLADVDINVLGLIIRESVRNIGA
jgi:hypothetical protein